MKKFTMFAALALVMVFAMNSFAGDEYQRQMGFSNYEGSANLSKAVVDTILLMGPEDSGAPYWGDFTSGWNGWTSEDITQPTETHWNISNYNQAVATNLAAWCGDIGIVSCDDSTDPVGGYGNDWNDILAWRATVADPSVSAQVTVTATLIHDTEPDYDYTRIGFWKKGNTPSINVSYDDAGVKAVNEVTTYLPGEYFGDTDIMVVFQVTSDGGWSDEDCSWPTAGACQVDDITVLVTQAGFADIGGFQDWQTNPTLFVDSPDNPLDPPQQEWYITFPFGVGDYAQLWSDLEEIDPCADNFTQQIAFIDDGIVVPGTGGSDCINWCYGPSGFIVNTLGGLVGPEAHIQNYVNSPIMDWPAGGYDGIIYEYGVYGHEDSSFDSPGIYTSWGVRSADSATQVITDQGWRDRNFVYFGAASYTRNINEVVNLMEPNRDQVQVRVGVYELGWVFGGGTGALIGNDGYPAPYFDNVAVKIFDYSGGPSMTSREIDLANDNFLEVDAINFGALSTMHVRFDMARNISPRDDLRNDPGDSIVVDVLPARSGATLVGMPKIRYTMQANPVFDSFRTAPTTGEIDGKLTFNSQGIVVADRYNFDLPDSGLMFPGDILHYHIYAEEDLGGTIYGGTYPADITGYGDFSDPMAYNTRHTINALPTITEDGFGGYTIPRILFWNDFSRRGGEQEWFNALRNNGLLYGVDYDAYYTGGPTSSVGSGLGGRTNGLALEGYEDLLYSAGTTFSTTLSNGDFGTDGGDDIGALLTWLSAGDKDMFLTGDGIAVDMGVNAGAAGTSWLETIMGLDLITTEGDIRTFIGNQATPLVLTTPQGPTNPVFQNISTWMAYGGCGGINTFDGVEPQPGAIRLAEFADPNGDPGAYSFAAATLNISGNNNRCISMPYDFMFIYTPIGAKADAPLPARSLVLKDVLSYFGIDGDPNAVSSALPGAKFAVGKAYPNPFNPITKIAYTLPKAGHMTMKVFNVRGQLVKTLVDGTVAAEGIVEWNGTNNQGAAVPSGVYFYETRSGDKVEVNKMALVK